MALVDTHSFGEFDLVHLLCLAGSLDAVCECVVHGRIIAMNYVYLSYKHPIKPCIMTILHIYSGNNVH